MLTPDLVVQDEDGKVSTVRYEALNVMLLNEFLKEHRKVTEQETMLTQQERTIDELKAAVARQRSMAVQQQEQIEVLTATVQEMCVCAS